MRRPDTEPPTLKMSRIVDVVCELVGIQRHDIDAPHALYARHLCAFVGRKAGHNWHQVGRAVRRDHTSVLCGARVVRREVEAGKTETLRLVAEIERRAALPPSATHKPDPSVFMPAPVATPEEERPVDYRHKTWGMNRTFDEQHALFAQAMREAYPELEKT